MSSERESTLLKEPEEGFEVGLDVERMVALEPPDLSASV